MRIAFDLDDTLIPGSVPFPLELVPRNPLRRMMCSERLRLGSPDLFNELWSAGHEVWVYTTSFRDSFYTKMLFRAYGTRVGKVINVPVHRQRIRTLGEAYKMCTKYPPAFNIDLLIDNCGGVAMESRRYNYAMLQVDPDDDDWLEKIRGHVGL